MLQHAENVAAQEWGRIGFEIPLINRGALNFVLDRSYEMSSFTTVFMVDRAFGHFESYVVTDPSVLL